LLGISLLITFLFDATPAGAQSIAPRAGLGGIVKDEAWAQLLGQTLLWDTIEVVCDAESATPINAPIPESARGPGRLSTSAQAVRTLLAHRPLEKYLWLIERAFDESVWKGSDRTRVEQNFALIWRVSLMLYESKLDSGAVRLRVCQPKPSGDDFECADVADPAIVVPIPSQTPLFGRQGEAVVG
jgi:hypothetical protein